LGTKIYVSLAHTHEDIDRLVELADEALEE